jgi:hypothetical protein
LTYICKSFLNVFFPPVLTTLDRREASHHLRVILWWLLLIIEFPWEALPPAAVETVPEMQASSLFGSRILRELAFKVVLAGALEVAFWSTT